MAKYSKKQNRLSKNGPPGKRQEARKKGFKATDFPPSHSPMIFSRRKAAVNFGPRFLRENSPHPKSSSNTVWCPSKFHRRNDTARGRKNRLACGKLPPRFPLPESGFPSIWVLECL